MKVRTIIKRLDDATSNLMNARCTLEDHVQSADGAKAVAAMMAPLIDELIAVIDALGPLKDARVK